MITAIIIAITVLISIRAFKDHALTERLIFHPPSVKQGEWYRLFSYGVLHADYAHLIFNMFTLYFFGMDIERICRSTLGETAGSLCFILLYLSALLVSILPVSYTHLRGWSCSLPAHEAPTTYPCRHLLPSILTPRFR